MPSTYATERMSARSLFMLRPSPAMIPDRMGIIGSTQGVKARRRPKPRKPASTSAALPWNTPAISRSLAKIEKRGASSTTRGAQENSGGDGEANLDRALVQRLRGETEGFFRLEQIRAEAQVRAQKKKEESCQPLHVLVSSATQARYCRSPCSIGTAMISGSSYGCTARI